MRITAEINPADRKSIEAVEEPFKSEVRTLNPTEPRMSVPMYSLTEGKSDAMAANVQALTIKLRKSFFFHLIQYKVTIISMGNA